MSWPGGEEETKRRARLRTSDFAPRTDPLTLLAQPLAASASTQRSLCICVCVCARVFDSKPSSAHKTQIEKSRGNTTPE
eukprot:1929475-Amphidinium_carterae.1